MRACRNHQTTASICTAQKYQDGTESNKTKTFKNRRKFEKIIDVEQSCKFRQWKHTKGTVEEVNWSGNLNIKSYNNFFSWLNEHKHKSM